MKDNEILTRGSESSQMAPRRLISLTDCIFAFSMTLLILSINLPDPSRYNNSQVYFLAQYQGFGPFVLSFLFLAFFWLNYSQQYHHIKRTDAAINILNILILLFVVLVPFSTSVLIDYPRDVLSGFIFNANILILTLLLLWNWKYSLRKGYIGNIDNKHMARINLGISLLPLIPLSALILSLFLPGWNLLIYITIPFLMIWPIFIKHKQN